MAPRLSAELIPAMITPFKADGSLDLPTLTRLAQDLADNGCDGLLVNGTTGEAPTLNVDEKQTVFRTVQEALKGRATQLVAGVGSNDTRKSVEEAMAFVGLGAQTLLVVVPYYNKPTQEGMFQHFKVIAEAVPTAEIVIYNIPGRSVVLMSPETMQRLHQACPNIIGVKQSHGDMDAVSEITERLGQSNWRTWSGDDILTLPMLSLGAHGVFSVLAHLAAPTLRAMVQAYKAGDQEQALELHLRLLGPGREIFFLPNPSVTKTALQKLGRYGSEIGTLRLPMLAPADPPDLARVDALVANIQSMPCAPALRQSSENPGRISARSH